MAENLDALGVINDAAFVYAASAIPSKAISQCIVSYVGLDYRYFPRDSLGYSRTFIVCGVSIDPKDSSGLRRDRFCFRKIYILVVSIRQKESPAF